MLTRIADLGIRLPRRVLGIAALLLVAAAVFGIPVASQLSAGGYVSPDAPSTVADNVLTSRFHAGDPNLVFDVSAPGGVGGAAARTAGERLVAALRARPNTTAVSSYWTAPPIQAPGLRSDDGRGGLVVATVTGDDDQAPKRAGAIVDAVLTHRTPGVTVTAGGQALAYHQVTDQTTKDLATAEEFAVPLTGLALIWIFGSVIAAAVPLVIGLLSIAGSLAVLRVITSFTTVSIYAMNLTTALSLALAIDYSLFIVNRHREEIHAGRPGPEAVRTAMRTAGRTVLLSALTVGLALAALLVFPVYFLRSFAYAGVAVVALAAVAALVVLPALLTVIGGRVDSLDLRVPVRRLFRLRRPTPVPVERGFWYRLASRVMRRALPVGLAVTALLLVLGAPFLGVRFGYPDDRVLPTSASARQLGDELRQGFSSNATGTITVVLPDARATGGYAEALSRIGGVTSVTAPDGTYAHGRRVAPPAMSEPASESSNTAPSGPIGARSGARTSMGSAMSDGTGSYVSIRTSPDPMSDAGTKLLDAVRATPAPGRTLVTGPAAQNADSVAAIGDRLPLALALIAVATFCVLFLFTGSIVLPLKTLVLNTLSLSATFGAMVWIFQDGHLLNLFGSVSTGSLVATMPVLMFCVAFGTSMDYEVFLLSRIREEWLASDRTRAANTRAVGIGIGRTGRIVTSAAVLMAIVFASLATGQVSFMQMFGTGLVLAVLMDATLVRGVLVPAFMRLMGRANWWAPGPLARWHDRHGWTERERGGKAVPDSPAGRPVVKTG